MAREGGEEEEALLDALSAATACFRRLVRAVGSTADSARLREELRMARHKAQELAAANRAQLTAALRDGAVSRRDREALERSWVCFSACLEALESDLRRALELGRAFPLDAPGRPLIQTGISGSPVGAQAEMDQSVEAAAADWMELEQEIDQMGQMMEVMETKVNVPRWTVEAKQDPGAELNSSISAGASSVDAISAESKAFCDLSKVLAGSIFTAAVLTAIALAACVAKLA